jgi:hypothetical protein
VIDRLLVQINRLLKGGRGCIHILLPLSHDMMRFCVFWISKKLSGCEHNILSIYVYPLIYLSIYLSIYLFPSKSNPRSGTTVCNVTCNDTTELEDRLYCLSTMRECRNDSELQPVARSNLITLLDKMIVHLVTGKHCNR